jgi:hypothetical protein
VHHVEVAVSRQRPEQLPLGYCGFDASAGADAIGATVEYRISAVEVYFQNVCSDGIFCSNIKFMIEHADFSVVVKNRARPPKPWRWEIYRAGRTSPIEHSEIYFESMTEANRAGKAALRLLLSEYQV